MNIFTSNSLIFNIIFLKTESNLRQPRVETQEDLTSVEAAGSENEEEEIDGGDSEVPHHPADLEQFLLFPNQALPCQISHHCPPLPRTLNGRGKARTILRRHCRTILNIRKNELKSNARSAAKSCDTKDEDEHFMLSCVPTLKKLSPNRKIELKCKIQPLLLEYTSRYIPPPPEREIPAPMLATNSNPSTLSASSQPASFSAQVSSNPHALDTVFCRIHAPARTPKIPEGRLYSGIIRLKSNDVRRLRGFPNLQFRFQWRENRAFMHTQLTEIKWLLVILDL